MYRAVRKCCCNFIETLRDQYCRFSISANEAAMYVPFSECTHFRNSPNDINVCYRVWIDFILQVHDLKANTIRRGIQLLTFQVPLRRVFIYSLGQNKQI